MNASSGGTDPADANALDPYTAVQDPGAHDPTAEVRTLLQAAIFEVTPKAKGGSLPEIKDMLRAAFSRRGVHAPTATWLDAVASAASYGEPYIIDFPAALAAEATVPAPNQEVRERLASRRKLREQRLPAGILPPYSDQGLETEQVPAGDRRAGRWPDARRLSGSTTGTRKTLTMAGLTAAALLAFVAVRAMNKAKRGPFNGDRTERLRSGPASHVL